MLATDRQRGLAALATVLSVIQMACWLVPTEKESALHVQPVCESFEERYFDRNVA